MKFYNVLKLVVFMSLCACSSMDKEETAVEDNKQADTAAAKAFPQLKTDYPDRVYMFKKMPDSTVEQQVVKYERFSALFIEYVGIYKNQPLYSFSDQENNTEAYNVLRDEMVSLKEKLRKNMMGVSKYQEARLDSADARMNKFLPQVYK